MEECSEKAWNICNIFDVTISGAKILRKFRLPEYFSKVKRQKCDQKQWTVCNRFGMITLCEVTYSLGLGPRVSLKVANKVF